MGRYYNKKKDLIVCPDNDEDEIYAGEYYPRRHVEAYMSLEYLSQYYQPTNEKTIALVTGIYDSKGSADSVLILLKSKAGKAFVSKAELYMGCLH